MDIELYYEEKGQGAPMIFLHGNGGDSSYFRHQIEHFSKKYRTISIDTRGHGKTPRGEEKFTINQFSRDLLNFMDIMKIAKAIIVGFSDGANIAMELALIAGDRILALILNGGNTNPSGLKRRFYLKTLRAYKIAKKYCEDSQKAMYDFEMLGLMVNEPKLSASQLNKIKVPTLVISGTDDLIPNRESLKIAKSIKNSVFILMRGGHCIAEQKPGEFNSHVDKFLSRLDIT